MNGAEQLPDEMRASLRGAKHPVAPTAGEQAAMVAFASKLGALPPVHPLARFGAWKTLGLACLVTAAAAVPALRHRANPTHTVETTARIAEPPAPRPSTVGLVAVENAPVVSASPRTARETSSETSVVVPSPAMVPHVVTTTAANHPVVRAQTRVEPPTTTGMPPVSCPVLRGDEAVLTAATQALATDPEVTLACVQLLATRGGTGELRDEYWFLGFDASRRLGRTADARRWAQQLLAGNAESPYARRVRRWMGTSPTL